MTSALLSTGAAVVGFTPPSAGGSFNHSEGMESRCNDKDDQGLLRPTPRLKCERLRNLTTLVFLPEFLLFAEIKSKTVFNQRSSDDEVMQPLKSYIVIEFCISL